MHAKVRLIWCFCICQDSWCDGCSHTCAQHISLGCAPQEIYFLLFRGRHILNTQSWRTLLLFSKQKQLKLNFLLHEQHSSTYKWDTKYKILRHKQGRPAYEQNCCSTLHWGCINVHAFPCVSNVHTYVHEPVHLYVITWCQCGLLSPWHKMWSNWQ